MTNPQFDESRPHPWLDPLQSNGALTHQSIPFGAEARIAVRNPIKRMCNGTRSGNVDWQATSLDLAANLYATAAALTVSRGLIAIKNDHLEARDRRIDTLEKQLENQRETIRQYRTRVGRWIDFSIALSNWWAWEWFAPERLKSLLRAAF